MIAAVFIVAAAFGGYVVLCAYCLADAAKSIREHAASQRPPAGSDDEVPERITDADILALLRGGER